MKDKIQHWLLKAMMVVFVVELVLSWIAQLFRNVNTFHLVLAAALVSCVAYFIRERRRPRQPKPRSTSSGERTPVMPRRNL